MHALTIITSIIITIGLSHHFGGRAVESFDLDLAPNILRKKNSTIQPAPYIYKFH